MYKKILSQKAFGLLEIIISAAVAFLLITIIAKNFSQNFKSFSFLQKQSKIMDLREFKLTKIDCEATVQHTDENRDKILDQLKNDNNTVVLSQITTTDDEIFKASSGEDMDIYSYKVKVKAKKNKNLVELYAYVKTDNNKYQDISNGIPLVSCPMPTSSPTTPVGASIASVIPDVLGVSPQINCNSNVDSFGGLIECTSEQEEPLIINLPTPEVQYTTNFYTHKNDILVRGEFNKPKVTTSTTTISKKLNYFTILLVIDTSGSMNGNDPTKNRNCNRKKAVETVVNKIKALASDIPQDEINKKISIGAIKFSSKASVLQKIVSFDKFKENYNNINFCESSGSTNYEDAFILAKQMITTKVLELSGDSEFNHHTLVLFISDGVPTTKSSTKDFNQYLNDFIKNNPELNNITTDKLTEWLQKRLSEYQNLNANYKYGLFSALLLNGHFTKDSSNNDDILYNYYPNNSLKVIFLDPNNYYKNENKDNKITKYVQSFVKNLDNDFYLVNDVAKLSVISGQILENMTKEVITYSSEDVQPIILDIIHSYKLYSDAGWEEPDQRWLMFWYKEEGIRYFFNGKLNQSTPHDNKIKMIDYLNSKDPKSIIILPLNCDELITSNTDSKLSGKKPIELDEYFCTKDDKYLFQFSLRTNATINTNKHYLCTLKPPAQCTGMKQESDDVIVNLFHFRLKQPSKTTQCGNQATSCISLIETITLSRLKIFYNHKYPL